MSCLRGYEVRHEEQDGMEEDTWPSVEAESSVPAPLGHGRSLQGSHMRRGTRSLGRALCNRYNRNHVYLTVWVGVSFQIATVFLDIRHVTCDTGHSGVRSHSINVPYRSCVNVIVQGV